MTSRQPSNCVFIGNIAYDSTKEELIRIFSEVGPVVNFRMVIDKDSGRPKGFAFCEYKDSDSALSARRNLDGKDLHGRNLRVDFADNKGINMPGESNVTASEKKQMPNETVGLEKMKETISQVPKSQLYEAVAQMKQLVLSDPDHARQIFRQNPTLGKNKKIIKKCIAVVMLHAQYLLGMENQSFETKKSQSYPTRQPQQQPQQQIPQQFVQRPNVQQPQPPQQQQQQPNIQQQQQLQKILQSLGPQQLKELLSLTPQQLQQLPMEQRQQVILIQQHAAQIAKGLVQK